MTFTCETAQPFIHALVDGETLTEADLAAVHAHVDACASCRGLLTDLERLRAAARSLGPMTPPDRLRDAIARRLPASPAPHKDARARGWTWMIAAAVVLLVSAAGVLLVRQAVRPAPGGNAAAAGPVQAGAGELDVALQHYDAAVAELEGVLTRNAGAIDPATASTIHSSVVAIDRAIAESRAALASNPQSESAQSSLFMALRDKITVLQTAVALIQTEKKS